MTVHVPFLNDIKTKENERPAKETPRRGFQSLAPLRRSRSFLPHDAPAHLRSFIPFFYYQPRYAVATASCDWHAAYGTCGDGEEESEEGEEGRGENGNVSQTTLDVQRCC